MPIKTIQTIGNWNKSAPKYGWDKKDIGILTNEKAIAKIKRAFSKTEHEFNIYFLRHKEGKESLQLGGRSESYVKDRFGLDFKVDDSAINVIFTQNLASDRTPMTAWTMAHRIGHLAREIRGFDYMFDSFKSSMKNILKAYNVDWPFFFDSNSRKGTCAIMNHIGTMRSCRHRRITRQGEFAHELIAQAIISNKVKFNPLTERVLLRKRFAWGRPNHDYLKIQKDKDLDDVNGDLECLADTTYYNVDSCLHSMYGKALLM